MNSSDVGPEVLRAFLIDEGCRKRNRSLRIVAQEMFGWIANFPTTTHERMMDCGPVTEAQKEAAIRRFGDIIHALPYTLEVGEELE